MQTADIIVIGAGIAGASAAALLAEDASVILIEAESQPGYHTTGRSAALFIDTYGNKIIRLLTKASRSFFESNAEGLAEHPLLSPRGCLHFANAETVPALERLWSEVSTLDPTIERISAGEALELMPVLRPEVVADAIYEPRGADVDVATLHNVYLRLLRSRKGRLALSARVTALERGPGWIVRTESGESFSAPMVVNAAGAWADEVAELAGLPPLGLSPKRRTALIVAGPPGVDVRPWPFTQDAGETFYFRPETGKLLLSPADETESAPCDAQPEDLDVAIAVDRFEQATTVEVRRVEHKWAGLRTFAPDRTPVVGLDPLAENFFWLAGQGGYGIQTAPAMARCVRSLAINRLLPPDVAALGVTADMLAPERFRRTA